MTACQCVISQDSPADLGSLWAMPLHQPSNNLRSLLKLHRWQSVLASFVILHNSTKAPRFQDRPSRYQFRARFGPNELEARTDGALRIFDEPERVHALIECKAKDNLYFMRSSAPSLSRKRTHPLHLTSSCLVTQDGKTFIAMGVVTFLRRPSATSFVSRRSRSPSETSFIGSSLA
jgi:hypothetical protein